jgi:hypothetical protein
MVEILIILLLWGLLGGVAMLSYTTLVDMRDAGRRRNEELGIKWPFTSVTALVTVGFAILGVLWAVLLR